MGVREWLLPDEDKYFDLFEKEAKVVKKGAKKLLKLTKDYENLSKHAKKLDRLEHECDTVVHDIYMELNKSFITPFDREDIWDLAKNMDDIMDMMDAAVRRLEIYGITDECPKYLPKFADTILEGVDYVCTCIRCLRSKKGYSEVDEGCIRINDIENDADLLLADSLRDLFRGDDIKYIIQMKDIYKILEVATDKCENVAHILQGIVVKEG